MMVIMILDKIYDNDNDSSDNINVKQVLSPTGVEALDICVSICIILCYPTFGIDLHNYLDGF